MNGAPIRSRRGTTRPERRARPATSRAPWRAGRRPRRRRAPIRHGRAGALGAAAEHVVEREGHLEPGGVDRLGAEVREPGHERRTEGRVVPHEREDDAGIGAEPAGQVLVVARFERGDRRVHALAAEQPQVLGPRSPCAVVEEFDHGVDRVGCHAPVGGELAAGDGDDAARRHPHRMATRQIGGLGGPTRAQERAKPRPGSDHIGFGGLLLGHPVERRQQVVDVGRGARRIVDRPVVVGVGGAQVGRVAPRDHEDRTMIAGHRHDGRDVVAHLGPRQRDVDPLGRTDRRRVGAFVERPHVVGPDPCGVHDRPCPHRDVFAVDLDPRPTTRSCSLTTPRSAA